MSPIKKAIMEVRYRIPPQLLEKVFVDGGQFWRATGRSSIEDQIETLVIRPRVLVDCNMVGGVEVMIPLEGLEQIRPMEWTTVIHIPKERTRGKSINSVLNVNFFNSAAISGYVGAGVVGMGTMGSANGFSGSDNSAMTAAASGVMSAFDKIPMTSTSRVDLIAENTILVSDGINLPNNSFLRCILANDEDLSGLQLRSYPFFCNLVEYAVKAYIYNQLIITIDTGELYYGQNLGAFKEVVSSYADANQNYIDYLRDVMQPVFVHQDPMQSIRFMKLLLGGNR